jgi:GTP:adenosylcobinamide-phosphate guanylyltransferase
MDAIVTAGGIPQPEDPLYPYTRGDHKAFIEIAGKPMIQWVLDALDESEKVGNVVITGFTDESKITSRKTRALLPNQGSMLENIRTGAGKVLELNPDSTHVLTVSSDIPSVKPEMIDWIVDTALQTDHDLYYHIITREVMEARFPTSKRTYVHLKGMQVCGGDLNILRTRAVLGKEELWERIIDSRKNAFKQAALVGYGTLLRLLLRALTIEGAEKTAAKRLGVHAKAVICPYAEIGMDVDKPHQLEIMRAELSRLVMA